MEDSRIIREKIIASLSSDDGICDVEYDDIAFHMTDWVGDLQKLVAFYENPADYSDEQVTSLLMGFLGHVPNHIAAASKLLLNFPVTDLFNCDALNEDDRDDVEDEDKYENENDEEDEVLKRMDKMIKQMDKIIKSKNR